MVKKLFEYENLAAYKNSREKYMEDSVENRQMNEKMKDINEMYVSVSDRIGQSIINSNYA